MDAPNYEKFQQSTYCSNKYYDWIRGITIVPLYTHIIWVIPSIWIWHRKNFCLFKRFMLCAHFCLSVTVKIKMWQSGSLSRFFIYFMQNPSNIHRSLGNILTVVKYFYLSINFQTHTNVHPFFPHSIDLNHKQQCTVLFGLQKALAQHLNAPCILFWANSKGSNTIWFLSFLIPMKNTFSIWYQSKVYLNLDNTAK